MKLRFSWLLLGLTVLAMGVGYVLGIGVGQKQSIRSCAELGVAYLELGKQQLAVRDFGSPEWQALIEEETRLVQECQAFFQQSGQPGQLIQPEQPVFCTLDAKICPDGTAVGRTGPDCEFAPCPGEE